MVTIKLPYKTTELTDIELIDTYIHQYNSCLRYMYNRVTENKTEKDLRLLSKQLNHIEILDTWFIQSAIKDAFAVNAANIARIKEIHETNPDKYVNPKIIFGSRKVFIDKCQNKISRELFLQKRLRPLYSIGESGNKCIKGNRKFYLNQDLTSIIFKPNLKTKITLTLPILKNNVKTTLTQLYTLQNEHKIALTYRLSKTHIHISYDEKLLSKPVKHINNRILAIDLNPNYIGLTITDWLNKDDFKIIASYVFDIKLINDKEYIFRQMKLPSTDKRRIALNNKRTFETFNICKTIVDIALHYNINTFSIEELELTSKDNKKGKAHNKLLNNNWLRSKMVNNLIKRCNLYQIKVQMVKPAYSSIIGNLIYRETGLPDMCLASIEIARRANLYNLIYI